MSQPSPQEQPDRTDLAALPLFTDGPTTPAPKRPGRSRGSFSLPPEQTTDAHVVVPFEPRHPAVQEPSSWSRGGELDWALVASMRQQTADRLSQEEGGVASTSQEQRERGRAIVWDLVGRESTERARAGEEPWSLPQQEQLVKAVFDAVFGLGRLQPLVDDDQVENIMIFSHDRVVLELAGGRLVSAPPVADSDQDLIDFLTFVASRSEVNARPFSPAHPQLHLKLDGGARLAATAWVSPRPQVMIRRHRHTRISLADLVGLGSMSAVAASFLAAAVKAGKTIVVAGAQGAGKTTVVRGLCNEIPATEVIGTFETEYELMLHEMPDRHPYVYAWEGRPGSGEVGPDGRKAGEHTLMELLDGSFRFNLTRQIVGEVRGAEALAMIKAMQSGAGSISTTHARSGVDTLEKLILCVMDAGEKASPAYARHVVAHAIEIVVFATKHVEWDEESGTGQVTRFISEIVAVSPGEEHKGYATTHVFKTAPGAMVATPGVLPDDLGDLARFGFDHAAFREQQGGEL